MLELQNKNEKSLNLEVACRQIEKLKGHSKINDQITRKLYTWITCHPQAVQSPRLDNCLKTLKKCIIALSVIQMIEVSKRQGTKKIISLSVILHYVRCFHYN